jgi:hypothetical protein
MVILVKNSLSNLLIVLESWFRQRRKIVLLYFFPVARLPIILALYRIPFLAQVLIRSHIPHNVTISGEAEPSKPQP